MSQDWKKIGKIKDAHGLRGDLYVLVFSGDTSWLKQLKQVQLQNPLRASETLCLEAERVQSFKDGLKIKFKELTDRTAAEKYIGWDFCLPTELFVSQKGETIFLGEILNFVVFDGQNRVGQIEGFSSNGPQDLLLVKSESGKVYDIPFVEAFVQRVDWQNQQVIMTLPEGLLEIDEA